MSTSSLLWIRGKRAPSPISRPTLDDDVLYSQLARVRVFSGSRILNYVCQLSPMLFVSSNEAVHHAGQAPTSYFRFDCRNSDRRHLNDVVPFLSLRPSVCSDNRCDIPLRLIWSTKQPNDRVLSLCLKEILSHPDHPRCNS